MSQSAVTKHHIGFLSSLPVGSIIAWHKHLAGTPNLPPGWAECNGLPVDDIDSPYHLKTVPDLNGEGRFLRGAAISGEPQVDRMQTHKHMDGGHGHSLNILSESGEHKHALPNIVKDTFGAYGEPIGGQGFGITWPGFNHTPTPDTATDGKHSHGGNAVDAEANIGEPISMNGDTLGVRIGSETRPVNMSVV